MPMTPFDRQLGLRLLGLHQFVYDHSGGLIGHQIGEIIADHEIGSMFLERLDRRGGFFAKGTAQNEPPAQQSMCNDAR